MILLEDEIRESYTKESFVKLLAKAGFETNDNMFYYKQIRKIEKLITHKNDFDLEVGINLNDNKVYYTIFKNGIEITFEKNILLWRTETAEGLIEKIDKDIQTLNQKFNFNWYENIEKIIGENFSNKN